jgi:phospholipid/cholesterol/gamma-HCH transport system permease protein
MVVHLPALGFEISTRSSGTKTIAAVRGPLLHGEAAVLTEALEKLSREHPEGLSLDLSGVEELDGGAAAVLADFLESTRCSGREIPLLAAPPTAVAMLELFRARDPRPCDRASPAPMRTLEQVGLATLAVVGRESGRRSHSSANARSLTLSPTRSGTRVRCDGARRRLQIERVGADGVPIVLPDRIPRQVDHAFQAAVQLSSSGADTFVADLVALSLTRELTPLLTAIVIAGRSAPRSRRRSAR